MADMMQFDLVSPERMLASFPASEIEIPGAEGDLTALPGHAPYVLTLRPGIIRAKGENGTSEYVVTGGFVELNSESISILAERAFSRENVSRQEIEAVLQEAEEKAKVAEPEHRDVGEKLVADLAHLLEMME